MKCQSCRNKDLCKWTQDMLRLDEICGDTLKNSESPVSIEVVCKRYQSEAQEISSQVIKEIRENSRAYYGDILL